MNINTPLKGHCHSRECVSKKGGRHTSSRFCETSATQTCWKGSEVRRFTGTQWMRQQLQTDGWHLAILHHLMRPCSSIYEEEQMVEASRLSFYSPRSNDLPRRWGRCFLVMAQKEHDTRKLLAMTCSHDLQEKGLFGVITQCLQSYAVHKESLFCGQLAEFYQYSIMTRQIGSPWVKDGYMRVRESMAMPHPQLFFRRTDGIFTFTLMIWFKHSPDKWHKITPSTICFCTTHINHSFKAVS